MILNEDSEDTEKPSGIGSLAFVKGDILGLFVHPSIFSIRVSICA